MCWRSAIRFSPISSKPPKQAPSSGPRRLDEVTAGRPMFLTTKAVLMNDLIQVRRDGFIATLILNRPEKLNALTKAMWQALGAAVDEIGKDGRVRCVIIRGAGEQPFSPG